MTTQTIYLNMIPGSVPPVIHVSQYDTDEDALVFNLHMGSVPFTAGSTATIEGTKPDKTGFTYAASYSDNVVTADLTEQMTAVSGAVMCEIRITDGTNTVGTQNFVLMVEPAALADDTVISDTDIPLLQEAIDAAASAIISAAQADADLAQIFGTGTKIASSDNLNDYKTPGKYYADAGQSITNSPVIGSGFAMLVYPTYNVARPIQVVMGLDGSISVRAMYRTQNNTDYWSEWWKSAETKALVGRKVITTATNFNTLTTIGDYGFGPGVATGSAHCPIGVGGRLTVEYSAGPETPEFIRQTVSKYADADRYTRTTGDGGLNWGHWYQFNMTDTGA